MSASTPSSSHFLKAGWVPCAALKLLMASARQQVFFIRLAEAWCLQDWFHHVFDDLLYCLLGVLLTFWGLHFGWSMLARWIPDHWAGGYLRLQPAGRAILVRDCRQSSAAAEQSRAASQPSCMAFCGLISAVCRSSTRPLSSC